MNDNISSADTSSVMENWYTSNLINEYNSRIKTMIGSPLPSFFEDEAVIKITTYDNEALEEIVSKKGYEIDRQLNEEKIRLIFIAIAFRATLCLQTLLRHGANPNTPLADECSPIGYTAKFQFFEGTKVLSIHKDCVLTTEDISLLRNMIDKKVDYVQSKCTNRINNV